MSAGFEIKLRCSAANVHSSVPIDELRVDLAHAVLAYAQRCNFGADAIVKAALAPFNPAIEASLESSGKALVQSCLGAGSPVCVKARK